MIIYYDIVADKEVGSDSYDESTPLPGIKAIQSKRITVTEGEVNIGANASTEAGEEDESVDASEAQTVINVVHASHLQKIDLDKKEFKTLIKSYFKKLLDTINTSKYKALDFPSDYEVPADKKEAKAAEDAAAKALSKFEIKGYQTVLAQLETFKKNFAAVNEFIANEILAHFDECEFYTCEEGELGSAMIIPARFVGESTAPVFYFFTDGIREKKE
jgi:hypothetical protein